MVSYRVSPCSGSGMTGEGGINAIGDASHPDSAWNSAPR